MKRNLLALAIGAAVLLPLTAQAAPTVYGRLNLSVDYVDVGTVAATEPVWEVNSNSSRVGVKGNEKLSDDFTAVYKAEWAVSGDAQGIATTDKSGKDQNFDLTGRERYIGLKHSSFGIICLGAIDSPLKTSEDMVDVFNDSVRLDMSNAISGQSRLNNSINYVSPKILDVFGANVTFVPGENSTAPKATAAGSMNNDLANGISAAFSYEDDNLYLSAAMDKEIASKDLIRVVGRYKMDKFVVACLYQMGETVNAANTDEAAFVLSGSYEMDKLTFRGEVLSGKSESGAFNVDPLTGLNTSVIEAESMLIGVGVDYNFTQNTKAYGNLARITRNSGVTGAQDANSMVLGGGIEVRF